MDKIPTIFERDWDGDRSRVTEERNPKCEWVFSGEGRALRKVDGSCCLIRDGKLYKRREVKANKPEPDSFELASHDAVTGKKMGWVPVGDGPDDAYHREGFKNLEDTEDGTYELVGPKVQGGVEGYNKHLLLKHSDLEEYHPPLNFHDLKEWLSGRAFEGLVWHHPDGRMAKIKLRDFGLKRVEPSNG